MRPRVIACLAALAALVACSGQAPQEPAAQSEATPTPQVTTDPKALQETPSLTEREVPSGEEIPTADLDALSKETAAAPAAAEPAPLRGEAKAETPRAQKKSSTGAQAAKPKPSTPSRPSARQAKAPARGASSPPAPAARPAKRHDIASGFADDLTPGGEMTAPQVASGTGAGYGRSAGSKIGAGAGGAGVAPVSKKNVEVKKKPAPPETATPAPTYANDNAFYENTYQGGSGARERIEALIESGVVIDGKSVPLDALAADYRQPFPLPFDRALGLSVGSEHRAIEAQGGRTIIQVGLQGMQTETPERPPLRLSLVIDRSGSMAKEGRMEKVKEAAKTLVAKLGEEDQIAIVAFNAKAEVLCPLGPASRPEVLEAIQKLSANGGTNIYDGIHLGYQELQKLPSSDEGFRVTMLFSDGQVTAGVQDPNKFDALTRSAFASKISTTTFGVGLSFNEALMMKISQSGKGNYHFLRDAAGAEKAISRELEDYTHVVASDVLVRVKLADGVKLVRVLGSRALDEEETKKVKADEEMLDDRARVELGIAEDRNKEDEEGIKTLIPQFYLADTHVILMEVEIPPGQDTRPVAEVFLKYKDLVFARNQSFSEKITVKTAEDKEAVIASLDSSVKKNILGFQTGEVLIQAAEHLRSGKTAEAARVLEAQRELLASAARLWVDEDLKRDSELLARYQEVVASLGTKNIAGTEEGEALAKAFAFSGYQMGR